MGWLSTVAGGVIGFFVGGPVGAAIGAGIGATKVGEKVVDKVLDFVTQPFMSMFGAPSAGDTGSEAQRQQGVLVQRQGGNEAVPVIYGFRAVGGTVVYAETGPTGSTPANKYLWVAYVFCEGPVEGLKELHIDDHMFPESVCGRLNAGETVSISGLIKDTDQAWKYNDKVQFRWFPGIYYNSPSSSPVPADVKAGVFKDAPNFADNMVFNGVAVLFARYEKKEYASQDDANNDPFGGNVPTIRAGIMGRKVIGLATTMYAGDQIDYAGSATLLNNVNSYWTANTAYNVNSGRYSTNPAECLFDYLRNPRYGKGLLLTDLDKDSWVKAANKCNQRVTYYTGARGPILSCNYVVATSQTLFQNTKAILSGFRAYMPYIQGKYKLKIEDAGNETDILSGVASIVQTVTKDDIVSDVTYTGIERSSKYNVVTVTYVDPDQKWSNQEAVWPVTEAERQTYIAEDGGRENKGSFTIGTITNAIMARDMARLIFNKSRYQETCSFKMAARGFELEPGDNVYIQSNILNFGEIPWRVISTKLNSNYTFDVGCVRNPDTIYPYGRYNEPDVVRPTYVPRQNEVYLPRVNTPLLGIFPPSYAPMPINWTGNLAPGNLAPTFPNDPGSTSNPGGGAYDATQGGTSVTGNTGQTPLVVKTTNDVITFTGAQYEPVSKTWSVKFTPPNSATYAGVKFWWRQQGVTAYVDGPEVNTGNNTVIVQGATTSVLNNLIYEVVGRVKYANGEYSTAAARAVLTSGQSGINSQSTFTFNTIDTQPTNFVNLDADIHLIYLKNTSGTDSPKTLEFKITERPMQGFYGSTNIASVLVYYRPEGGSASALTKPYWQMQPFNLPANYVPYDEFVFKTAKLFGTTTETRYDLIFKFKFKDGTISNKQVRVRGFIIRDDTSGVNYQFSEQGEEIKEAPSIDTTNATAKLAVTGIQGGFNNQEMMRIYFWDPSITINSVPPSISNWAGVSVEIAKLVDGQPVIYDKVVERQISQLGKGGTGEYYVDVDITDSYVLKKYSVIVRATYYSGTGELVYSTHAKKYVGLFKSNTYEFGQIRSDRLVEQNAPGALYSVQKGDAFTTFNGQPADKKVIIPTGLTYWFLPAPSVGIDPTKAPPYVPSYKLYFNIPQDITFNKVRVYRRVNSFPSNLTKFEWTDITVSGTAFRLACYEGETVGGSYNFNYDTMKVGHIPPAAPNPSAFEVSRSFQEIYLKLYYDGGVSKAVTRLVPTSAVGEVYNWLNVFPTPYNSAENIVDLDLSVNATLKLQLDAADARVPSEQRPVWYKFNDSLTVYAPGQTGYQGPFK